MKQVVVCMLIMLILCAIPAAGERLPVQVFGAVQGIDQSVVGALESSRGLIWFCTSQGFTSFDGHHFETWGPEQGLPSSAVNDALEWEERVFWLATSAGAARLDLRSCEDPSLASLGDSPRVQVVTPGISRQSRNVRCLHRDQKNRLWAGTSDGLFVLSGDQDADLLWRRIPLVGHTSALNFELISDLCSDGAQGLWVTTEDGLFRILADDTVRRYVLDPPTGGSGFRRVLRSRSGRLWVAAEQALAEIAPPPPPTSTVSGGDEHFQPHTVRFLGAADGLVNSTILGMVEASNGDLFLGTIGELCRLREDRIECWGRSAGLSDHEVTPLLNDRFDNLWIGSPSGGLMRLPATGVTSYSTSDGLDSDRIRALVDWKQPGPLVLSFNSSTFFLQHLDHGRFISVEPHLPAEIDNLGWGWNQVAFLDVDGALWLASGRGVLRYPVVQDLAELSSTIPGRITDHKIFRIFEASNGDVWFSAFEGAPLRRWQRSNSEIHDFAIHHRFNRGTATAFAEDHAGNLWIGLYEGGVLRYREGEFFFLEPGDALPRGFVNHLMVDSSGQLWVATGGGGVGRLSKPSAQAPVFELIGREQGLSSLRAYCLVEDHLGRVYVGSNRGIDRIDPATGSVYHLTTADGIANDLVTTAWRAQDNSLWFGTPQGLSRLVPSPDRPAPPPRLWLSHLRIAGVAQPFDPCRDSAPLRLDYHQRSIEVEVTAPSFVPGERLRFQYRLLGSSEVWSSPSSSRRVQLAGLAPGRYSLEVRAVSDRGGLSEEPARLRFTIEPPLWKRWWFLSLLAALLLAAAYGAHRLRLRRLLAIEGLRARIAADLHDDIGSSLSQISILSEVARREVEEGAACGMDRLQQIGTIARLLVDNTRDIVWSINPRYDDLSSFIVRLREFASDMLDGSGIAWRLLAPEQPRAISLDPDQRRQLLLVIKEAITNVANHSQATEVSIELSRDHHRLVVTVRDNGVGFSPPTADGARSGRFGNGMRNMHTRIEALGGELDLRSQPGEGTTIRFAVELKSA